MFQIRESYLTFHYDAFQKKHVNAYLEIEKSEERGVFDLVKLLQQFFNFPCAVICVVKELLTSEVVWLLSGVGH